MGAFLWSLFYLETRAPGVAHPGQVIRLEVEHSSASIGLQTRRHSFNDNIYEGARRARIVIRQFDADMVYGTDPFSAQWQNATNTINTAASIFGALPYPGSASSVDPPIHSRVTLRFTSSNPSILNCSVVGPNNGTYFRIVTDAAAQGITLVRNSAGQNIALVEWRSHPTIEAQAIGAKVHVGQWLRLAPDRFSRTMYYAGVHYAWLPRDHFLQLFAPGSSEWLARVTMHNDAFVLEMSARAVELGLIDVAVLATVLMQSGRRID